jgi:tetratricopeptide (TPR) repeat protein
LVACAFALGVCAAPAVVAAEGGARTSKEAQKAAKDAYERGTTEYNLGRFDEAIKWFEKAYEGMPEPILLFNIAQANRQLGNLERAIFFYRRYLDNAPKDAPNRPLVETKIKELEELQRKQAEAKDKPPIVAPTAQETEPAGRERPVAPAQAAAQPSTPADANLTSVPNNATDVSTSTAFKAEPPRAEVKAPRPLRFGLDVGPSIATFAGSGIASPTIFSVRIFGGYSFSIGEGAVEIGAAASIAPLHYQRTDNGAQSLSSLLGAFVRGGARYPIALDGALHVIGDLGLGVVWWGGLGKANPFTDQGVEATGLIPLPTARIAAGLQYDLSQSFFVYVLPAYSFSMTTSGVQKVVSHVALIDIPAGIGCNF